MHHSQNPGLQPELLTLLADEFAALVRGRLVRLKPPVVERVGKATAKLGPGEWEFGVEVFFDPDFRGRENNQSSDGCRVQR